MAEYPPVCRVCLAINVNLRTIANTPLQFVYERLTSTLLHTADMRPLTACYMCYALLRKSYKLMLTSVTAENLLTEIVKRNSRVTKRSVSLLDRKAHKLNGSLVISPPECIESAPHRPVTANPAKHPPHLPSPPGGEPTENASPTPGTAVEIKIEKEEPHIKTEHNMEEMEVSPSPPDFEAPTVDEDIAMAKSNHQEMGDLQQQAPIRIQVGWDGPGMSAIQPAEKHILVKDLANSQSTFRHFTPRLPGEKIFKCSVCHSQFKYKNVYENHIRTHTGEKPFACPLCERKFSVSSNLQSHLKTHTSEKPYQCGLCDTQFKRLDQLKRHIETHSGEKPFQCLVCNRRFSRNQHLKRHSSVHSGEKLFECNVCQWRFNNKHGLQIHLRTHTGEKLYSCDICKREFKVKSTLRSHLTTNNGDKVFKCTKCKQKFHYRSRKGHSKMCKRCCLKKKEKLEKLKNKEKLKNM